MPGTKFQRIGLLSAMNKRLKALAIRRHLLVKTIDSQRLELAEISLRWKMPLAVVDTGINAAKFMHNHPALVTGSIAAVLAWHKNGLAGMTLQGWRALYL